MEKKKKKKKKKINNKIITAIRKTILIKDATNKNNRM